MFGGSDKKKNENETSIKKTSSRGNMDEYEALRTIVAENPGLLMRVLEKIRAARNDSNPSKATASSKDDPKNKK